MLHRTAYDGIHDEVKKVVKLSNVDKFSHELLLGEIRSAIEVGIKVPVGNYSKTGFKFKFYHTGLIWCVPTVEAELDSARQIIELRQYYDKVSRAAQCYMFTVIFAFIGVFSIGPIIGLISEIVRTQSNPLYRLDVISVILAVIVAVAAALWSVNYFVRHRESYWSDSEEKACELLRIVGVTQETIDNNMKVIRVRYSDS